MKKIILLLVTSITMIGSADAAVKKVPQVIEELVKSMNSGDADAAGILGDLNCDGFTDFDRDTTKAMIEKSYKSGSAFGKYSYGSSLQVGRLGFEKNEAEGKRLVTEAIPVLKEMAENNNAFACLMLYYIYNGGQSNEGQNMPESSKWLRKGEELGNPFCVYFLYWEMTNPEYPSTPQEEVMMEKFENLRIEVRFPVERVKILYAQIIDRAIKTSKFIHISYSSDGESVLNLFRCERFKCNVFLRYGIRDKNYTLYTNPEVYIEYNKKADINTTNTMTDLRYTLDSQTMYELSGCAEKMDSWETKAVTLYPPAFEKCINENRDKQKERAVVFFWDGLCFINYGFGNYGHTANSEFHAKLAMSKAEKDLLLNVFQTSYNSESDPHSFYKKSQAIILDAVQKQNKKQNLIDNNFN